MGVLRVSLSLVGYFFNPTSTCSCFLRTGWLPAHLLLPPRRLLTVHILHIMTRFLIHQGTKSHHFLSLMGEVALKDTYLISLPLAGTLPQNGSLLLR